MSADPLQISATNVQGAIQRLGAMAGPFTFALDDGRSIEPLAVAPWANDPESKLAHLPPLLRRLRGEWPCVPFGSSLRPTTLPHDWLEAELPSPEWHNADHGFSSNNEWEVVAHPRDSAILAIAYPPDHPIVRLERTVTCHHTMPAVDFSLRIEPRIDTVMPVGLHPVFRLPDTPGAARINFEQGARFWTFPVDVEPSKSALMADQRNCRFSELQTSAGERANIMRLPFEGQSEDLVLVTRTNGRIVLENYQERYAVQLDWDASALPNCILWLSNRGRAFYPWNSRFCAIGIEPVAAPFDLGPAFSGPETPLAKAGVSTGVKLTAGELWTTRYRISVTGLNA